MYGEIGVGMILGGVFLDIAESMPATERIATLMRITTIFLMWGGLVLLVL